jgi:hypothetical protein
MSEPLFLILHFCQIPKALNFGQPAIGGDELLIALNGDGRVVHAVLVGSGGIDQSPAVGVVEQGLELLQRMPGSSPHAKEKREFVEARWLRATLALLQ